ncbi:MAG TPA: DUF1360 domain-containing protein [Acidimicrobiales bacterium]|jgi:hypothetical protein|nr:DUF1360 domain-containing protein [Acidimicrobiales bacterium]
MSTDRQPRHLAPTAHTPGEATADAYRQGADRPLGAFLALLGAYGAAVGAGAVVVRRRGGLANRLGAADTALLTAATFQVSRVIAKSAVTSPLRAPFARFEGTSGEAELQEAVRGSGAHKAVGELLTCPFCIGQWVATGFAFGFIIAPRATRLAATVVTAVGGADVLHLLYDKLQ